jgi:hypothetical protein
LCGINPVTCRNFTVPYFDDVRMATLNHSTMLANSHTLEGTDTLHAFQYCFWMTLCQAIPYIVLLLILVYAAFALLSVPGLLVSSLVQCVVQMLAYTHAE